jgi:hypothetical protein
MTDFRCIAEVSFLQVSLARLLLGAPQCLSLNPCMHTVARPSALLDEQGSQAGPGFGRESRPSACMIDDPAWRS